jgi:hypothetical protein
MNGFQRYLRLLDQFSKDWQLIQGRREFGMSGLRFKTIYYYEHGNLLVDEDGDIVYDIFRIIPPTSLRLFQEKRGVYYVLSEEDEDLVYELVFPFRKDDEK